MSVEGRATSEATRAWADRFIREGLAPSAYRRLGGTGLTVSALGFGAYRVDARTPAHRQALEAALEAGCNLIDTSTNYTDGESEECIGALLQEGVSRGSLRREERVFVSKVGYVQGRNMELAREREASGDPFPGMVKISEGCWHCIHPRFLEDQLTRSLQRLRLERLDVCLLHNPEYFLEEAHRRGEEIETARGEFYGRIRAAFVHLESEVQSARIGWYGVSSNSFGAQQQAPDSTSLGRMLVQASEAAAEAGLNGKDHHFAVAQLPMNLFEHTPWSVLKEGPAGNLSTLGLASEAGIGVLVNRPLNAFHQGELVRLADFPMAAPDLSLRESLNRVAALEQELDRELGNRLQAGTKGKVTGWFDWAAQLEGAAGSLGGYEHWQAIQDHQITPRLFHAVQAMRSGLSTELAGVFEAWLERYLRALGDLLAIFRADCAGRSQKRSDGISTALNPALPERLRRETLSRKALHAVASVPGVTTVLNGMRQPQYVTDSLEILKWEPLADPERIFRSL